MNGVYCRNCSHSGGPAAASASAAQHMLNLNVAVLADVYPCCGRPAQRGVSQRPLPQPGCAYQPHTPLTPPEAPTYHLDPNLALSGTRLADSGAADSVLRRPGLVQTLLKHHDLIVRQSGEVGQVLNDASKIQEAEDRAQPSSEQQVICSDLVCRCDTT